MGDVFGPPTFTRPFQLYQVFRRKGFVLVFGIDKVTHEYSLLRIPRKDDLNADLELLGGEERFPLAQMEQQVREFQASDGGLEKICQAYGLIGFIRFVQGYYLILITKRKKVGKIGHHYVNSIEGTMMINLFAESAKHFRDEKAFRDQLNSLNLSKDFYFSYSYELSRTVQQNLADAVYAKRTGDTRRALVLERDPLKHHRFVWNHYHMEPFLRKDGWQQWCLSVIHGFFAYTKCSSFGWTFEIALIARRSRFYAGTRYRKRGLNVNGQVANDVETEQLLCDDCTRHLSEGHVMSFVQIRGSVPLFWTQEATAINPKPPVVYPRCDMTLSATRLHFADLLERYGTPQLVVNLMRAKKVDSYEVRLKQHFESAIERMNRELPPNLRILYRPFDMKSHENSSNIHEVFARLAESVVARVGYLHTSRGSSGVPFRTQGGVVRTNCVDCLDRTNVLQFFVGLEVLKQQLTSLNLLPEPRLDIDSQVVFVLSELYDIMGDHLALQYAGSVAHKKYQLLGSRPRMMTSSKELLTSIHRHYNNSFTDSEKQASLNLFLGIYQPRLHPRLSEYDCDSWLHHSVLRDDYCPGDWWTEPLQIYSETMQPLNRIADDPQTIRADEAPRLAICRGGDGGRIAIFSDTDADESNSERQNETEQSKCAWFREVHRVTKLTSFKKILSRLEATAVQINISTRRGTNARPLRTAISAPPLAKGILADVIQMDESEIAQSKPHDVAEEDLITYQTYTDPRQLNRLLWNSEPIDMCAVFFNLSRAILPLPWREEPTKPLMEVFRGIPDVPMASHQSFIRWFVRTYLSQHLYRERPRARGEKRAAANFFRGFAAAAPAQGTPQLPAQPVRLRLCRYCDAAYDAATNAEVSPRKHTDNSSRALFFQTARTSVVGRCRQQELCPTHQRRVSELERFMQQPSLTIPEVGLHGRHSKAVMITIPSKAPKDKPWAGWLRPTPTAGSTTTPKSPKIPNRMGTGLQASDKGLQPQSRELRRHLWAYAFPYEAPPVPDVSEMGLPEWWLDTPSPKISTPALVITKETGISGSPSAMARRKNPQEGKRGQIRISPVPARSVDRCIPSGRPHQPRPLGARSIFAGLDPCTAEELCASEFPEHLPSTALLSLPSPRLSETRRHLRTPSAASMGAVSSVADSGRESLPTNSFSARFS